MIKITIKEVWLHAGLHLDVCGGVHLQQFIHRATFLGVFLGLILVSWKVISNYLGNELNKAIEKASELKEANDDPIVDTK